MSKLIPNLVAALATTAGVIVGVCLLTLFLAGSANASPQTLRLIRALSWTVSLGTLAATVAAIVLMVYARPWAAAIVGGTPAVLWIVLVIVLTVLEI